MQAELAAVGAQGGRGCPSPDVFSRHYQTGRPVLKSVQYPELASLALTPLQPFDEFSGARSFSVYMQ